MSEPTLSGSRAPVSPLRRVVIVGSTASGKSALAMELQRQLGDCELISVDSMQVYRRMDIGTAKPSAHEQSLVPHHMIDLIEPSVDSSAGWFQQVAHEVLHDLAKRERRPIFVGGTGLYHRVVVDDLELPPSVPDLRAELEAAHDAAVASGPDAAALHTAELLARLSEVDPHTAATCEPNNARRMIRALEVTLGTGRPFSSYGPGMEQYAPSDDLMIGLEVPRDVMLPLLSARVHKMLDDGFLAEVESLKAEDPPIGVTARQALGYRELLRHLSGEWTYDHAVDETILRTRQFAVRQHRWFRRDPRIRWVDAPLGDPDKTASLARTITDTLRDT